MTLMIERLQKHRHLVLLSALLVMAMAQPIAHGFLGGLVMYDVLLNVILVGIVVAVFDRPRDRFYALILALLAIASRWAGYALTGDSRLVSTAIHHVFVAAFLGFAIVTILRGIFEDPDIRADHFVGTVCGYLLAGVVWGNCYTLADMTTSDAFRIAPEISAQFHSEHIRSFYFNYFSLSTLTGAGFGDITPVGPVVATLTWLEAAFGQFYIAVVVAQLVGMMLSRAVAR